MSDPARLPDVDWKASYRHEDGDLVELFYVPALSCAKRYDRSTGYFAASALALAARGVQRLIDNDGRMRLLIGCTLEDDEIVAIEEGYDLRQKVVEKMGGVDLTPPDEGVRQGLQLVAWMIAHGHMDVKIAVPVDPKGRPVKVGGIYHEKVGVIEDDAGNILSFSGSINETEAGWVHNRESFHVHCSWMGGREQEHVQSEVDAFGALWRGETTCTRVYEFPDALKERLLEFLPSKDQFVTPPRPYLPPQPPGFELTKDERRRIVWSFVAHSAKLATGERVGEMTSAVEPWPHQIRTYHRFLSGWPARLLIADEVGLGKTISAGLIIRQALLSGVARRVLLMTPKAVQIQWQNELYEKFNLNVPIYDGSTLTWRSIHGQDAREVPVDRRAWQQQPIVLVSSPLMRRKDRQRELLDADPWDLILLDEAHHARRRGAGSTQEKGPNALLGLMQALKDRCASLLLLTATPMQVHPVELWDLLNLLGLPPMWARDDGSLARYFELAAGNPSPEQFEELAALFRDAEAHYGPLPQEDANGALSELRPLQRKKILDALRSESSIRRRQLDSVLRRAALKLLLVASPLRFRMVRHTRALLRAYARDGKLNLPIPFREPKDVPVEMLPAEEQLYKAVEEYISTTYKGASADKRSAVGFVMTIYRRRLASSFEALKRTLLGRLERMGFDGEEDLSQDENVDEAMSAEDAATMAEDALAFEETASIKALLRDISRINVDSKARRLITELKAVLADGYDSAIVFTQFTDTMEYLRELLAKELPEMSVASYCGAGGAYREGSGAWVQCSKEEIKRRLRAKQVRLLVASDAAGEGLNLQTCGVLVNYDLPWNPMKVEQRIGRIDRLGQKYERVRIINLAYLGTVEADVYFVVGSRIQLFQGIVGKLQPILSRLPKEIERVTLAQADNREALRHQFLAEVEQQVAQADQESLDIDAATGESLEIPPMPEPAMTLDQIELAFRDGRLLPGVATWRSLDPQSYAAELPGMRAAVRVTTDADVFEYSGDSHQLFSPGGQLFEAMAGADKAVPEDGDGDGVCWIAASPGTGPERFILNTKYGFEEIVSLAQLVQRLGDLEPPTECPETLRNGNIIRRVS